ncbi:MAG TPA: glycosyltransferase family 4 protein [Candidatus Limnocylindria bacterium]|nr:glycosyltransferase family 4 protein [Candidatus Limnocylindria bacterium]
MYDVVLVAFEGPDRYSFVGGLATRMIDLADALVDRGHLVRHIFVGDPRLPAREERAEGRLVLERWSQWISAYHPRDVYDGEDGKWRDFSRTAPPHLVELVAASALRQRRTVLLFEDWQTADAAIATAAILGLRGRGAAAILWNANNTYGFGNIDFELLRRAASITTVSRFMRAELAAVGVDAAVLPNGIAERWLKPLPPTEARPLRDAFGDRPTFVKVARFDPDKRWLWAIDAIAVMRDAGARPRLLMRGSRNPYGETVGDRIRARGLSVERVALGAEAATKDLAATVAQSSTDILFLDYFIAERTLRAMYQAADGVLANSVKEPFGLVGLEVMASGGVAYVGRTGEDYAVPLGNSVVMQSDDPRELLATHLSLRGRPEVVRAIRADGRATAKRFVWPRVLDGYEAAWETAFALQT